MVLADSSVWIDFLRAGEEQLAELLERTEVLGHPWVVGEIALGRLARHRETLELLQQLPQAIVATDAELLRLVDEHELVGSGIGYVDLQLLASALLTPDARLWTHDRRLDDVAQRLGVA